MKQFITNVDKCVQDKSRGPAQQWNPAVVRPIVFGQGTPLEKLFTPKCQEGKTSAFRACDCKRCGFSYGD